MHSSELDSITWKLMAPTRALESAFDAWARGNASEADVSDQYVRLGNEFISARSKLALGGVPTDDLIDVPQQLRVVLEEALALDCSAEVAERFDPQIRGIMAQLFHQLKAKQLKLSPHQSSPIIQQSVSQPSQTVVQQPQATSQDSRQATAGWGNSTNEHYLPHHRQRPSQHQKQASTGSHPQPRAHSRSSSHHSETQAAPPSNTSYSTRMRALSNFDQSEPSHTSQVASNPPPIPVPKPPQDKLNDEDALSLLQRHGALERQASRRYSTRQISRMINGSASEQMSLPTTDIHKTFNAPDHRDFSVRKEARPDIKLSESSTLPETPEQSIHRKASLSRRSHRGSLLSGPRSGDQSFVDPSAKNSPQDSKQDPDASTVIHAPATSPTPSVRSRRSVSGHVGSLATIPASPGKFVSDNDFPVFLRLGNSIRKTNLTRPPSIAAIRLKFVEVCTYIHSGDETFPVITLQDPQSQINYEVTEATVSDVVEGSLLTLKVKTVEELSMEAELKEIKTCIKDLHSKFSSGASFQGAHAISSRNSVNKSNMPSSPPYSGAVTSGRFSSPVLTGEGKFKLEKAAPPLKEIPVDKQEMVNREIVLIKQLSSKTISALKAEIQSLKLEVKELSTSTAAQTVVDRRAMSKIKEDMEADSQDLLSQMENLSDIIDAQRVAIGAHGVRYPQNEIEKVRRQLANWSAEFEKSEEFIVNEKPVWKKTWQAELNNVIEDQEWLKSLDLLYADLRSDLEQSVKTFELVCEANALPRKVNMRQGVPIAPPIKPGEEHAVANAVFHEISALNFNHEERAEAVQRAERLHRARLALRSEEFEDELNSFVADTKLKPNGGFHELERRMREREEEARTLGEQSEAEARLAREKLKQERKAKRLAESTGSAGDVWHDPPSEINESPDPKTESSSHANVKTGENPEANAQKTESQ